MPHENVFIVNRRGWHPESLSHPAIRWIYEYHVSFEVRDNVACAPYYSTNMTYVRGNGQSLSGASALAALQSDFALPHDFHSDLERAVVIEQPSDNGSSGGYLVWAQTRMYANLPGEGGEKKHVDTDGKAWEAKTEGVYIVDLVRDKEGPHGLKVLSVQGFADPTPLLGVAVRRGVLPVEVLAGEAV
ncbi:hypothetical protein B0T16DRAFT_455337 [Cercophora newfieldiana]|uniref:Uncharacterized protein n=1 Tax=Cercophora newfieldiana TaxID=92897 RepID=A0AA39YL55_9PEZI|nr:hypothetical protein B0T16DRAFT_455337 [Cercophora newfieldiana]